MMHLNAFGPRGFVLIFAIILGIVGLLLIQVKEHPFERKRLCVNQFSRKARMRGNKWGLRLLCAFNNIKFIGAMLLFISMLLIWMAIKS